MLFIYDVFFVFITPFLTKVGPLCPPSFLFPFSTLADNVSCAERQQHHGGGGHRALEFIHS